MSAHIESVENKMVQLAFLEAQSRQRMETEEKNYQKFEENQAHWLSSKRRHDERNHGQRKKLLATT